MKKLVVLKVFFLFISLTSGFAYRCVLPQEFSQAELEILLRGQLKKGGCTYKLHNRLNQYNYPELSKKILATLSKIRPKTYKDVSNGAMKNSNFDSSTALYKAGDLGMFYVTTEVNE